MYKKMFHAMLDKHDAMMVLLDPDTGQIIDTNQAANRFYGYTAAQLNNLNINDLSSPFMLDLAELQAGRTHFVMPQRLASGEICTVEMYVSAVTWQEQRMFLAIIHDITEHTRAEEALRESEQKLKTLLDLLPIGISVLNTDNKIAYMNPALEQILQISQDGLLRGDYQKRRYIHPDGTNMQAADFASSQAIQKQQPVYNVETGIVTENDQTIWTNVSAVPVAFSDWRVIVVSDNITERKQMEEVLHEKHAQHLIHELFEAIPTPIFYKDIRGRYLGCNQAFASVNKKSVAEIIGRTVFEIWPTDNAHKYNEMNLALLAQPNVPQVYEYNIYHQTLREERTFLNTRSVIRNVHDQITGIVGVMIDITERKRIEDSFQESEQIFRTVVESVSEAILMINSEGAIMLANSQATQMFGYTHKELLGQDLEILLPERYRHKHAHYRAHYFTQPQIRAMGHGLDFWGQHKDGHEFPLEIGLSYAEIDGNVSVTAFITDITERKRMEDALRKSEERWQYALKGSDDGVWDWNPQTNEVFFSPRWKEMLGYAEPEISSDFAEWDKRLHPDDKATTYEQLAAYFRGETPYYMNEHRLLHRDGNYRWHLARGKVMSWTEDGKPLRMVGTQTDITERKQLQLDLQASEARYRTLEGELRQLNAQKDRFLAIIAHDLRNPFSVILGLSDYLNHTWVTLEPTDLKMAVEAIQSAAHNLYKLLESLLAWAANQRNDLAFEPMPLNIAEIGREIMDVLELNAHPKAITLHNLSQSAHLVYADYNMISTIIRNLLSNAIKFTPNDGQVTLTTEAQTDFIKVSITDTGVGIAPEHQVNLFQLDNKFKTYGTAGEEGTGLGLLLCQQLVHKNGGEIGLTSVEGQGSTFYFTLPKISLPVA